MMKRALGFGGEQGARVRLAWAYEGLVGLGLHGLRWGSMGL